MGSCCSGDAVAVQEPPPTYRESAHFDYVFVDDEQRNPKRPGERTEAEDAQIRKAKHLHKRSEASNGGERDSLDAGPAGNTNDRSSSAERPVSFRGHNKTASDDCSESLYSATSELPMAAEDLGVPTLTPAKCADPLVPDDTLEVTFNEYSCTASVLQLYRPKVTQNDVNTFVSSFHYTPSQGNPHGLRLARLDRRMQDCLAEQNSLDMKLKCLMELEEVDRAEIFGDYMVSSKLIELAVRRIYPKIRVKESEPTADVAMQRQPSIRNEEAHLDPESYEGAANNFSPREDTGANEEAPVPHETVKRYEILSLSGTKIDASKKCTCKISQPMDLLSVPEASDILCRGDALFRFVCKPFDKITQDDKDALRMFINITSFRDEWEENRVPIVDTTDVNEMKKYILICVKTMYILPGINVDDITPELVSSVEYQRACQPGNPKIWDDVSEPYTFRCTKPLVRFIFSLTFQMKVSMVTDPETLRFFQSFDGLVPSKIILIERTKRNKEAKDTTHKVKSVLMYHPVTDGILVSHITLVLNTSIPRVVATIVNNFSGRGAAEGALTVDLTRAYLLKKFGDARQQRDTM